MDLNGDREKFAKINSKAKAFLCFLFLVLICLGISLPFLVSKESLNEIKTIRQYVPGELSDEDVIAPFDLTFIDEVATQEAKANASKAVLPIFTYSLSKTSLVESRCNNLINSLKDGSNKTYDFLIKEGINDFALFSLYDALSQKEQNQALLLFKDCVQYMMGIGIYSSYDIDKITKEGYTSINSYIPTSINFEVKGAVLNTDNLITEETLYEQFILWLAKYNIEFSPSLLNFVYNALNDVIDNNIIYDESETARMRDLAASEVDTITHQIKEGDFLIKKDTIVTEQALRTIDIINSSNAKLDFVKIFGQVVFFSVVTLAAIYYFFSSISRSYRIAQYTFIFIIGVILSIIATYFVYRFVDSQYISQAIPFLFIPLLLTHITNRKRYGFTVGILFICYLSFLPDSDLVRFFYMVFVLEVSLLFVRFGVTRLDVIYQAFYSSISAMFITVIFHFIGKTSYAYLLNEILVIVMNICFSYMLLAITLPLLEYFLNIPTVFRLHELCLADTPVLSRLRSQAVGTFNHVNNVSDMAYHAAKEIGVNSELARVGGLYHDIGKGDHPEYFIENQKDKNVHDDMKVTLSAAVIKSHVKSGVEKGKEMGLPQEVIDIIDQHHGNDLIQYFYNLAVKEAENSAVPYTVNEEDFRYNSDIPQTPEAAIVMLADCFEAASRTIKKPTTQRYEKLATSIFNNKINGGQLNDSKLTLTDLEKIKKVFVHDAFGRDHQRIEYNKDDNK
ncbi:HDIG domain-containing protein [Spirochaetales bacterium NM-380-WT-3C1]|uniref:HDIG domain-containing protein n=2 Tax=Bullifex porci TaxID=2606638 RepID=A0A7X2PC11_9SPIO|nr:HDIG domain-containing metalloprotein [Bullifex porci]MSU05987.1 HDIG domain-containing protein [Bullifex porci]